MKHFPKDARIAIVGAGPAGLGAAEALKEKGYQNVTLFEKLNRAGGQSLSLHYETGHHKPIVYEQGSMAPTCSAKLYPLFNKYQLHLGKSPNLNEDNRDYTHFIKVYSLHQHKIIQDFSKNKLGFPPGQLMNGLKDCFKLGLLLYKYRALAKVGFQLTNEQLMELSLPYCTWIDHQQFKVIGDNLKILGISGTMGNPQLKDEIQATLMFKFIFACLNWFPNRIRYVNGHVKFVREGYQELWNRVGKEHHIIYNSKIQKIIRKNDKIHLLEEDKNEEVFDVLLMASSLTEACEILDVTDEELNLFNKVRYNSGWRVAFLAKGLPHDGIYFFLEPFLDEHQKTLCPLPAFQAEGEVGDGTWLYTSAITSTDPNIAFDDYCKQIEGFLKKEFNAEVVQWLNKTYWPEFVPHFDAEDVKNGIYQKIDNLQGKQNTYYLGGAVSGSMHGPVVDYSYSIVDRFFK